MTNLLVRITTAMEYDSNIDGATFSTCVSPDVLLNTDDRYFYEKVRVLCFRGLSTKNVFYNMTSHIKEQYVIDNHKTLIISAIIDLYVKIRMHHEGKLICEELKASRIRSKNAKLTLFAGQ